MEGIYNTGEHPFFLLGGGGDVPSVEFMYPVFTRMPGRVIIGESGLRCCVPLSVEHGHVFSLLSKEACFYAGAEWLSSYVSQKVARDQFSIYSDQC